MSFFRRAISALRKAVRTTRRIAKNFVHSVSNAALAMKEAVHRIWTEATEMIDGAWTASTNAVCEVQRVISENTSHLYGVLKDSVCEARVVRAARAGWNWWNTNVPRPIRLATYGVLIGAPLGYLGYLILGFGPTGIIAGSPAASMHSSIGNVLAGSWFATMQSLGATGKLPWIMSSVGGFIGAWVAQLF